MARSEVEIAALKEKYAAANAEKEAKKAVKKQRFEAVNAERQIPTVEMRVPSYIDLEKPPWSDYLDALEHGYRFDVWKKTGQWPEYEVKRKVIQTDACKS